MDRRHNSSFVSVVTLRRQSKEREKKEWKRTKKERDRMMSLSTSPIHGCYYTNWAVYRPEPYKFTPDMIPVGLCTHIFYAFAAVNISSFGARMTDEWSDIGLGNFQKTQNLKKTNPGLKTLLSFGGWTESLSGIYNTIAADPIKRSTFIQSAWQLANDNDFDGIDMDWEYPGSADRANFVSFIKELKEAGEGKLLTLAVSAGTSTIDTGYDVPLFEPFVDLVNVMSYDFHGSWEDVVGHQAAYSETIGALSHWASLGMPKSKLLMGIPAYGRGWMATSCTQGAATTGLTPAQKYTQDAGIASYFELMLLNGTIVQSSEGPYLQVSFNGIQGCYGYDNIESILKKMAYIVSEGYGGAFSWTIDFDDKGLPVHYAILDGLKGSGTITIPGSAPSTVSQTSKSVATTKSTPVTTKAHTTKAITTPPPPSTVPAPVTIPSGTCITGDMRANVDRKKYEQCLYGTWIVRDCPPGTVFNPIKLSFEISS